MAAPTSSAPAQTTRRTAGDVKDTVDDFTGSFAAFRTEVEELIEVGGQVVAVVRHVGRVGAGDVERRETHLWEFADGRPRALREFEERDAALAAARRAAS